MWRFFAREIEADLLRFYRVDVRSWFSGEMDSRRLLTLIDGLPDESTFKTWAFRGGDWTPDQYVAARTVNELALARADGKGYMPQLLRSPLQMAEEEAEDAYRRQRHEENLQELRGGPADGDHD